MGNSYKKINFMILDKTPIEVISASRVDDFDMKDFNAFCNRLGTFSMDVDDNDHYFFREPNGKFVEFKVVHNS